MTEFQPCMTQYATNLKVSYRCGVRLKFQIMINFFLISPCQSLRHELSYTYVAAKLLKGLSSFFVAVQEGGDLHVALPVSPLLHEIVDAIVTRLHTLAIMLILILIADNICLLRCYRRIKFGRQYRRYWTLGRQRL